MTKYEKKKQNLRGSVTYGSGSAKKNRGSGNRGGVGKAGIWDHKKSSRKYYEKIKSENRIQKRKKLQKTTELVARFIKSKTYVERISKKGVFIDNLKKEILIDIYCKLEIPLKFLDKLGYIIIDKRQ